MRARTKGVIIGALSAVVIVLLAALLFVGNLLGIVSCTDRSVLSGKGFNPDYAIAVIQTSRQKPSTYIEYYDKDLNLVASLEYPFGSTQSPWGTPAVYDGVVYMTPQTKNSISISSFVAALDMTTGKVTELDADGGVTNIAVNDRYVFAAAQGGIGRIDRETGEVLSINQKGRLFPHVYADKLYVFNDMRNPPDDDSDYLLIYDTESMELIEEIAFDAESSIPQTTGFIGERLYFELVLDSEDTPREDTDWNLAYYSIADGKIHILVTITGRRIEQAALIGERLYAISLTDGANDGAQFKLLIINEQTGAIESTVSLDYSPMYLYASEGVLYVNGDSTTIREGYLYSYVPTEDGLEETGRATLPSYNTQKVAYYSSGMFAPRQ